jgi:hypothetical protein
MFFKKSQAMPIDLGLCPTGRVLLKKIAEGHNGSISVESKVGCGTTFFLALPVTAMAETKESPSRPEIEGPFGAYGKSSLLFSDYVSPVPPRR